MNSRVQSRARSVCNLNDDAVYRVGCRTRPHHGGLKAVTDHKSLESTGGSCIRQLPNGQSDLELTEKLPCTFVVCELSTPNYDLRGEYQRTGSHSGPDDAAFKDTMNET